MRGYLLVSLLFSMLFVQSAVSAQGAGVKTLFLQSEGVVGGTELFSLTYREYNRPVLKTGGLKEMLLEARLLVGNNSPYFVFSHLSRDGITPHCKVNKLGDDQFEFLHSARLAPLVQGSRAQVAEIVLLAHDGFFCGQGVYGFEHLRN